MNTTTFRGGIHPDERKERTASRPFENVAIPHLCRIPLTQHIGKPAVPCVAVGDVVAEGQLIARADGMISSNVHASIPGRVVEIAKYATPYSRQGDCIVIEAEGNFSSSKTIEETGWKELPREELLGRIREAGIVGLGGAAFPTHVKLAPPPNKTIDTLVINGAECEPYLTVDDNLTRAYPDEIIQGVSIILSVLGIKKAIIGIEDNKPEAISILKKAAKNGPEGFDITVRGLRTKYPQGAEKQLIYTLLRREVPSGGFPMDCGVVVQNIGTAYAIYHAVACNRPLYERFITVSGDCIKRPGNYRIRVGMLISDIIEECGGLIAEPAKVVLGGPMCGLAIETTDMPVVKGTSGILFLSEDEIATGSYDACIRCGRCVGACPIHLIPSNIARAVEVGRTDLLAEMNPLDCIMCGSCAFMCPSRRPLNHFIKLGQQHLRSAKK